MNPQVLVFNFPGNAALAGSIARTNGYGTGRLEWRHFPDGESYLRLLGDCSSRTVVLVASQQAADSQLLPLAAFADTARELGADRVVLVAPYLAYMRQDIRFNPGEAVTSRSWARLLSTTFDGLLTVDPHLHRYHSLGQIYALHTRVCSTAALLAEWIGRNVSSPMIVGPDSESHQWVGEVARRLECDFQVLDKIRHGDREVAVSAPRTTDDPAAVTPVLVDDIISTAQTMAEGVRMLRKAGYPAPICVGVHALFAERAWETLERAGAAAVITTNSVAHPSNGIDLGGLLATELHAFLEELDDPPPAGD